MTEPAVVGAVPGIVAGFTTRAGGVSRTPFDSMNLAVSTGDDRELVEQNRALLLKRVGFAPGQIAIAGQVHGTTVALVKNPGLVLETDGLVTQTAGLLLGIVAADCAVVLVSDESGRVVGAAHAGWRGAAAGIVTVLVSKMQGVVEAGRLERSQAEQSPDSGAGFSAYISPCISQSRFEVGPEVAERFDPEFVLINEATGKHHIDIAGSLRAELLGLGLHENRIQVDGRCTYENPAHFFSFRAQKGVTGRMMGYIGICP